MYVTFKLKFANTKFGQSVFVVGETKNLGNWKVSPINISEIIHLGDPNKIGIQLRMNFCKDGQFLL